MEIPSFPEQTIWLWLVCEILWQPLSPDKDTVDVSFHFAPLQNQFQVTSQAAGPVQSASPPTSASVLRTDLGNHPFVRLFSAQASGAAAETAESSASAAASPDEMKPMMSIRRVCPITRQYGIAVLLLPKVMSLPCWT